MDIIQDSFLQVAARILCYVDSNYDGDDVESLEDRLALCEALLRLTVALEDVLGCASEFIGSLHRLVRCIEGKLEQKYRSLNVERRLKISIEEEKLRFLVETGFHLRDLARMFRCSTRTVERRLQHLNISLRSYSMISDEQLDFLVSQVTRYNPRCGEKSITGRLRSVGILVQRERVRASLRWVDPNGVVLRFATVLHRRVYTVHSPNALWHIDGYHKLIRWKIVIHGGIDGYSRLITYLQASTNNRAATVLSAFQNAVQEYGLPSRVRMDAGGENVLVSHYMAEMRGIGRNSTIVGRSVHKQRIERLWRDLFNGCINFFYHFLYFMEDINILNPDNPLDLYALHYVIMDVLQENLIGFKNGWGHHPLRTEHNRTPMQLWVMGLVDMEDSESSSAVESGICDVCFFAMNRGKL